jgi:hypothetical protein
MESRGLLELSVVAMQLWLLIRYATIGPPMETIRRIAIRA